MSRIPFPNPEKISLEGLQSEISGMLARFWHRGVSTGPLDGQDWAPPIELRDEPNCYRVTVELPGVDATSIDVTTHTTRLIIRGDKLQPPLPAPGEETAEAPVKIVRSERPFGSFKRIIDLPGPVQIDRTEASLDRGILEITLPKSPGTETTSVRVDIKTSEPTDPLSPPPTTP